MMRYLLGEGKHKLVLMKSICANRYRSDYRHGPR